MKNDKIIPGIILVLIGVLFLLDNFGVINFHWMNVLHLWPIFLVIGGVNLVFAGNHSPWAYVVKIGVVIAGFALLLYGNYAKRYSFWPGPYNIEYNDKDDDDDNDSTAVDSGVVISGSSHEFKQDYTTNIKQAHLIISGGGTTYRLNDTTNNLFKAAGTDLDNKYELSHDTTDSVYTVDMHMKNKHGFHINGNNSDKPVTIKLNPNPIWDIDVKTGASELNFDLSKFKIRNINIKGGAASYDVKLGDPLIATNVEVSTGVSEVTISVPKTAACKISTSSGLSSHEFAGFTKKADNEYQTDGYDAAKNKIYIHMTGGVSDFKVNRY